MSSNFSVEGALDDALAKSSRTKHVFTTSPVAGVAQTFMLFSMGEKTPGWSFIGSDNGHREVYFNGQLLLEGASNDFTITSNDGEIAVTFNFTAPSGNLVIIASGVATNNIQLPMNSYVYGARNTGYIV
jgi:hypothetical protein